MKQEPHPREGMKPRPSGRGEVTGRAKTTSLFDVRDDVSRAAYRVEQRAAVLRALSEYAPDTMVVFDVDLGHTDPQQVIPYGGWVRVDGPARRITVRY